MSHCKRCPPGAFGVQDRDGEDPERGRYEEGWHEMWVETKRAQIFESWVVFLL